MKPTHAVAFASLVSFAAGVGAMWAQQQGQTTREPQFENELGRAWKTTILPNQPLTLHRHEHARALIALTDVKLDVVDKDNKKLTSYDWKAGKAYWLEADPPGQMHADVNVTGKPVQVIVVEYKKDK